MLVAQMLKLIVENHWITVYVLKLETPAYHDARVFSLSDRYQLALIIFCLLVLLLPVLFRTLGLSLICHQVWKIVPVW